MSRARWNTASVQRRAWVAGLVIAGLIATPAMRAQAPRLARADLATFDARSVDVAGLRVGGSARDFNATVTRLFGKPERVTRSASWYPGFAAALEVNAMGCFALPGRRNAGEVGNVCVTAFLDADDIVRVIRIERVFPFLDEEAFRTTMVRRYGAASAATDRGNVALGWGPLMSDALSYDSRGPRTALTAHYNSAADITSRSLGAAPRIRVTLQLIDVAWVRGGA